jgi:hypothetical protein
MVTPVIASHRNQRITIMSRLSLAAGTLFAAACTAAATPSIGLAGPPLDHAAAAPKGGRIYVFADGISHTRSRTTVTGAIGDHGYGVTENARGGVDPNGDYEKVVLSQGTFVVNEVKADAEFHRHATVQLNHDNCSFRFSGSGTATIGHGTGAYAGITGTVTITLNAADIAPRKGGQCNFDGRPTGAFGTVIGHGVVSFS